MRVAASGGTAGLRPIAGLALFGLALASVLGSRPALAFTQITQTGKGGKTLYAHWSKDLVPYWVDPGGSGVRGIDANSLAARAFGAWEGVSTARIRFEARGPAPDLDGDGNLTLDDYRLAAESGGFEADRRNVLVFDDTGEILDELYGPGSGVLGVALPVLSRQSGAILDADILIDVPGIGRVDLEAVLVHEIGHLCGLGHTPIFHVVDDIDLPTLFPSANPADDSAARSLETDDVAGISALYPEPGFALESASLAGHVAQPGGQEAFGVHVLAYQPRTSIAVGTMTGLVEGPGTGTYRIEGLPPGTYTILVEAVDGGADIGGVTLEQIGGIFHPEGLTGFPTEIFNNVRLQTAAATIEAAPGTETRGIDFVTGFENGGSPLAVRLEVVPNRARSRPAAVGGGGGCATGQAPPSVGAALALVPFLAAGCLRLARRRASRGCRRAARLAAGVTRCSP